MAASGISIIGGDITTAHVDAIVNAANPGMLGGGGVDGAIHLAAGPELLAECQQIPDDNGIRCPTGQARITTAANLPARYVIHTVGPRYGIDPDPATLLTSAYRHSLQLALQHDCRSIAFPAISCGVYGYPITESATIACAVCSDSDYQSMDIRFYLFNTATLKAWKQALQQTKTGPGAKNVG